LIAALYFFYGLEKQVLGLDINNTQMLFYL